MSEQRALSNEDQKKKLEKKGLHSKLIGSNPHLKPESVIEIGERVKAQKDTRIYKQTLDMREAEKIFVGKELGIVEKLYVDSFDDGGDSFNRRPRFALFQGPGTGFGTVGVHFSHIFKNSTVGFIYDRTDEGFTDEKDDILNFYEESEANTVPIFVEWGRQAEINNDFPVFVFNLNALFINKYPKNKKKKKVDPQPQEQKAVEPAFGGFWNKLEAVRRSKRKSITLVMALNLIKSWIGDSRGKRGIAVCSFTGTRRTRAITQIIKLMREFIKDEKIICLQHFHNRTVFFYLVFNPVTGKQSIVEKIRDLDEHNHESHSTGHILKLEAKLEYKKEEETKNEEEKNANINAIKVLVTQLEKAKKIRKAELALKDGKDISIWKSSIRSIDDDDDRSRQGRRGGGARSQSRKGARSQSRKGKRGQTPGPGRGGGNNRGGGRRGRGGGNTYITNNYNNRGGYRGRGGRGRGRGGGRGRGRGGYNNYNNPLGNFATRQAFENPGNRPPASSYM